MKAKRGNKTGRGGFADHPENINRHGQINALQVEFGKKIRMALIREGQQPSKKRRGRTRFESMILKVWELAELGTPWAIEYVSERTEGKITQPIGEDPNMPFANKITIFQYGSIPEPEPIFDVDASTVPSPTTIAKSNNGHNGA